ncbi:hypothetical protein PFDG_00610 [Plasmodium falciparum Dd2]|uniref:mRNA 5'-phosphatase n=1 Tax=Plasmodium falciparum (isolate Dd2) TaxID=57267 RepID=A0A0L7LY79_PLAF4|nr:hypothetical protein PFDG_00610 [Plasmodium falciparum Dd2]
MKDKKSTTFQKGKKGDEKFWEKKKKRMVREAHELLDGSRPIPIDKITYELSQNIILAFDNHENINNKDIQIEIEGRVGLVIDKNKNRIKLPINTDAIIENNYSDFQAGIDRESFEYLLDYFHNMTLKKRLSIRNNDNNNNNMDNNNNNMDNNNNNMDNNNNNNNNNIHIHNSGNNTNQTHSYDKNADDNKPTCNYSYDKKNACIYDFLELKTTKSIDKYYVIKNNNSRIRTTTYLNDDNKQETESMMIQSLQKDNLNIWNVYTGNNYDYFDDDEEDDDDDYNNNNNNNNNGDTGTKTNIATNNTHGLTTSKSQHIYNNLVDKNDSIDYRISINIEYTKPISKLYLSKNTPVHERLKERTTFINTYLGLQVDMTKIKTKNNELYEVEIEIPSKTIFKAMSNLRNKKDSNYLHFICSNLVNNIRGICSQLNVFKKSKHMLKNTMITKLNNNSNNQNNLSLLPNHPNDDTISSKEKEKFKKYIHSVLPIVGDYMYRVVTKNEKHIKRKIKDQLITNKEKINIFKNNVDIRRHNKKSLQTINEVHVENKWKAFKRGTKIEVLLCSDDEEYEQNEDVQDINNEYYDQYKNEEDTSLYINNIYMHNQINY